MKLSFIVGLLFTIEAVVNVPTTNSTGEISKSIEQSNDSLEKIGPISLNETVKAVVDVEEHTNNFKEAKPGGDTAPIQNNSEMKDNTKTDKSSNKESLNTKEAENAVDNNKENAENKIRYVYDYDNRKSDVSYNNQDKLNNKLYNVTEKDQISVNQFEQMPELTKSKMFDKNPQIFSFKQMNRNRDQKSFVYSMIHTRDNNNKFREKQVDLEYRFKKANDDEDNIMSRFANRNKDETKSIHKIGEVIDNRKPDISKKKMKYIYLPGLIEVNHSKKKKTQKKRKIKSKTNKAGHVIIIPEKIKSENHVIEVATQLPTIDADDTIRLLSTTSGYVNADVQDISSDDNSNSERRTTSETNGSTKFNKSSKVILTDSYDLEHEIEHSDDPGYNIKPTDDPGFEIEHTDDPGFEIERTDDPGYEIERTGDPGYELEDEENEVSSTHCCDAVVMVKFYKIYLKHREECSNTSSILEYSRTRKCMALCISRMEGYRGQQGDLFLPEMISYLQTVLKKFKWLSSERLTSIIYTCYERGHYSADADRDIDCDSEEFHLGNCIAKTLQYECFENYEGHKKQYCHPDYKRLVKLCKHPSPGYGCEVIHEGYKLL